MPNWLSACDILRAQSPHTGGMNLCLADGGVRFVSGGISLQLGRRHAIRKTAVFSAATGECSGKMNEPAVLPP